MANIFKLRRRASPQPDEAPDASARLSGETRQAAENETRRRASDETARDQTATNAQIHGAQDGRPKE